MGDIMISYELLDNEITDGLKELFVYDRNILTIQYQSAYEKEMDKFREKYIPEFHKVAEAAERAENNEEYMSQILDYLTGLETEQENSIKQKYKRSMRKTDTRLYLVLYVLPVMAESGSGHLKTLADSIVAVWPERFGGAPISYTTSEKIGSKFGGDWLRRLMGKFGK